MLDRLLKQSAELVSRGETFVMATVVRCTPPTSGKPGDKAIIHPDGKLSGWIGGGCAQPVVIREALKSLADGKPRLVRISPAADGEEEGVVDYTMTCHSGGALDIYIEPVLPNLHVVILGRSPVARTLAQLARAVGYDVSVVVPAAEAEAFGDAAVIQSKDFDLTAIAITPWSYLVVSTQGEGDEEALEAAVSASAKGAPYVAFVASKTKAGKVIEYLREKGVAPDELSRVKAPAGLDLGSASPEEIAVSILAEIIQLRRARAATPVMSAVGAATAATKESKDPVCGMTVEIARARHKSLYEGTWLYFCCAGCKEAFEKDPVRYATAAKVTYVHSPNSLS
jgi:xanthine dehydrogenase accessory factor